MKGRDKGRYGFAACCEAWLSPAVARYQLCWGCAPAGGEAANTGESRGTRHTMGQIKITIETDEVIIIRHSDRQSRGWCLVCGQETILVTGDSAVIAFGLTVAALRLGIESGDFHVVEDNAGVRLCVNSLVVAGR